MSQQDHMPHIWRIFEKFVRGACHVTNAEVIIHIDDGDDSKC